MAPENGSSSIFGHTVSALQGNVEVEGDKITGELAYVSEGALPDYWGPGNFIVLKFTAGVQNPDDIKVGLVPSVSSGMVSLDADMNAAIKITDKNTQKLYIEQYKDGVKGVQVYDLSGLTCATE